MLRIGISLFFGGNAYVVFVVKVHHRNGIIAVIRSRKINYSLFPVYIKGYIGIVKLLGTACARYQPFGVLACAYINPALYRVIR